MRTIRLFIYGVPLALVLLLVAAFVNSTRLTQHKKNEFTYASIGEPTKLNPIQSTDQSASEVEAMIFEGLLTLDEKLELTPSLASEYEEYQITTFIFRSAEAAAAAEETLNAARSSWEEWTLTSIQREGDRLTLRQELPGFRKSEAIAASLDGDSLVSLETFRVDLGDGARETLQKFRETNPEVTIEREWFDYNLAFEITVRDELEAGKRLREFVESLGIAEAGVRSLSRRNLLAEPVLRFKLHENVRWHDGVPFTSADCVFTYECLVDEQVASPRKADFDSILSVQAPTPHEFIVKYRTPYSPAILSWTMLLLPKHVLEGKSQEWWSANFNRHPIGTGPFKFDSWKTNEFVRVVRNPDYWRPGPWLDAVVFRSMPDPTVLRLAFETHQVDLYEAVLSPWAVRSYRDDPRFTTLTVPSMSYSYLGWNMRKPIFQDVNVRRALAMALDVESIIKYLYYGIGQRSTGILIPEMWFANHDMTPLPYDPEQARRLLDETGWIPGPDGVRQKNGERLSFKIITNQGNDVRKDIATLAQDSFRRIGVEVTIEIYEWAVFIERFIKKHEFESTVLGWITPPNWDQYQVWHSSQTGPDQLNYTNYRNPEADRIIEALREEYDRDEIARLASELQQMIYDEQPMLFLISGQSPMVIWKDTLRIRRKDEEGHWIDTPFAVAPGSWYQFIPETYRTDYAESLPKETEVVK